MSRKHRTSAQVVPERDPRNVAIGALVARRRKEAGLSTVALAEAVGVTRVSITRIEAGAQTPSLTLLRRLADRLNVPLTELAAQ